MGVRRTAVVKLAASDEQRGALHRTAEQYLYCANRTANYCWPDISYTECKINKRQVRDALYSELREQTDLQAQLVQAAQACCRIHQKRYRTVEEGTAHLPSNVLRRNDGLRHAKRNLLAQQAVAGNC